MKHIENQDDFKRKRRTSLDEEGEASEISSKKNKRKKSYKPGQNPASKNENDIRKKIRFDDA